MINVRRSEQRGDANHGWLKSKHTFSFANYYDERFMGFGVLRVINEDRIDGGTGFETHGHRDMEIISYVIKGALQHRDSMGNATVIRPGEVQRMSAGTGIQHSEYNDLKDQQTHFLQIWILPEKMRIAPSYGQKSFAEDFRKGELVLVASRDGRNGSVSLNQNVNMYAAKAERDGETKLNIGQGRRAWVQVINGEVHLEGETLRPGDGAGLENVEALDLKWLAGSEFIVFDLF